jgi:hypothetical protein
MNIKGRLNFIENALKEYGYVCELVEPDDQIPFHRLSVSFGADDRGRQRVLMIRFDELPVPQDLKSNIDKMDKQLFIRLIVAFPFSYKDEATGELARLLLYFNKPLEIPGFGLDEINKTIYYSYSLISGDEQKIESRTLVSIVSTIMLLVDSLTPQIEAVAQGLSMKAALLAVLQGSTG